MAKTVFTVGYLLLNGVDLSTYIRDVSFTQSAAMVDSTTMGGGSKTNVAGLKDAAITGKLAQDFIAGSGPDATIPQLLGAAPFAVEVRPANGSRSVSNPAYTGNFVLESYIPIQGAVGVLQECSFTLKPAGAVSRLTA